jgi:phage-related holin
VIYTIALLAIRAYEQIISAAYKLDSIVNPSDNFSTQTKVLFYILNSLMNWLSTLL